MTLGEKIKEARKHCGLTQEELAMKLMVSRQAITKWESDKGIPDIQNIKALASLLQVSVDYLLDDGETMECPMIREPIHLDDYKKPQKHNLIRSRYPDSIIYNLLATKLLTKSEKIVDNVLWLGPTGICGIPQIINSLKNVDQEYYLVKGEDKDYLVLITTDYLETRVLPQRINEKTFEIGDFRFKLLPKPLK